MNRLRSLPRWIWVLLLVCIWVSALAVAVNRARKELGRHRRMLGSLVSLRELESRISAERTLMEGRHGGPAADLMEVVGSDLEPNVQVESTGADPLPQGLQLTRSRIHFQHLRWDQVRDLITRLESGLPPWRVVSLEIETGLRDLSGHLDVTALERPGSAPAN
jgi:hypothetical protein